MGNIHIQVTIIPGKKANYLTLFTGQTDSPNIHSENQTKASVSKGM